MTDKQLSPAAEAVLDAFIFCPVDISDQLALAAALRAVVLKCEYSDDYGTCLINPDDILAIAKELEGKK